MKVTECAHCEHLRHSACSSVCWLLIAATGKPKREVEE